MEIKEWAGRVRQLRRDDTFMQVIEEIRKQQIEVFLAECADMEDIEQARNTIEALLCIDNYFDSVEAEEKLFDKKHKL